MAHKYRFHLTVAAALCVAMTAAGGAARAEDIQTQSVTISAAGLDLASSEGQSVLFSRINKAIKQACASDETGNLAEVSDYKKCVALAKTQAGVQTTALIVARTGNAKVASAAVRILLAAN